jgi:tripartite-type tricarboxylate transporter receptor subunit TctC
MFWIALAVVAALATCPAMAQDAYPNRTVRIVAGSPGGNPDILARLLAQKLSISFGQSFAVENMPGAGGSMAPRFTASARPDGYVLGLGDSGTLAINSALKPNLNYDPLRDFTAITALIDVPTVLVVHPSVPAKTLQEFVDLAKSKPGELNYGSPGVGSIHQFTHEMFAERAGIKLQHVPYRTAGFMVNAVLAGIIEAGWSGIPNIQPLIETGKLRALCISTSMRARTIPMVPTCAELGYAGFDVAARIGLIGPAGLPTSLVAQLQSAVAKALREPDIVERMNVLGMQMQENGTADYQQFIKDDLARYVALVARLGIKPLE